MRFKLWRWVKALALWSLIAFALWVWNREINPFDLYQMSRHTSHNNQLAFSVLVLGGATYLAGLIGMGKLRKP